MSHFFLTFLGLGKKTYLQDSKHWSIKNITCPLISGSSFLYSFSSKFAKFFFLPERGGMWYLVFDLYLPSCDCQQPRLLKFYQRQRVRWQERKHSNTSASGLLKDRLKDMWLIAMFLLHVLLKIVPQATLHVPQEHCMSDYKDDCWLVVI